MFLDRVFGASVVLAEVCFPDTDFVGLCGRAVCFRM